MKNPFYPAERRKFYLVGALLSALTIPMLTLEKGLFTEKPILEMQRKLLQLRAFFGVLIMSIFVFVAISSSVMAIRLTTRPGISSELLKSFAIKQAIYLSIYTLSWVCYFEFNLYVLFLTTAIK